MDDLPDSNRDEAARWLANVEDDLRALDAVLRDDTAPSRIACFLAHLAVEKALKATLIDAGIAFAKTHDVTALHRACIGAGRLLDIDPCGAGGAEPLGDRR
jgi:HEPN domain-containing protein